MKKYFLLMLLLVCSTSVMAQKNVHVNVSIVQGPQFIIHAHGSGGGHDISLCSGARDTLHVDEGAAWQWSPAQGLSCPTCQSPVANPTTSTTYVVKATNASGCTAYDTVRVTVNAAIVADAGVNTTICSGDSVILSSSGGQSYKWKSDQTLSSTTVANPTAKPISTTTYYVTVSSGTCPPSTDSVTITVLPAATKPTISKTGNALSSTTAVSYQWYLNGVEITNATSQQYTVTVTGAYTVKIRDNRGCSAMSDPYNIDKVIDVREDQGKTIQSLALYPNPNNGKFTVQFDAERADDYLIRVHDILGRLVYEEQLKNFSGRYSSSYDLVTVPKGMNSFTLRSRRELIVRKIVTH